ncbi:uncharacterized protein [Procambarus clarkii]|uniref:uncharacterized protein n=1 Tax=Procambarus clarkii TaxID=6728 RepID=UPI00374248E1
MQLKKWLLVALVAVILQEASPIILLGSAAATAAAATAAASAAAASAAAAVSAAAATKALALTAIASKPVLEVVGGTTLLLGTAGLVGKAAVGKVVGVKSTLKRPTVVVTPTVQKTLYRYGRAAPTVEEAPVAEDFSVNAIDILFSAAETLDTKTNCGLRVVCELAATPVQQLAPDEALLMSLFGDHPGLVPDQINSPVMPFQLAAFLGNQSGSTAACASAYHKCHFNSTQIMNMIRQSDPHQL